MAGGVDLVRHPPWLRTALWGPPPMIRKSRRGEGGGRGGEEDCELGLGLKGGGGLCESWEKGMGEVLRRALVPRISSLGIISSGFTVKLHRSGLPLSDS